MPDSARRFAVQFPCVTMRENLGGKRAIVVIAGKATGGSELVLATCMDIDGRLHQNVPFNAAALQYAFQNRRITLMEVEGTGIAVPSAGLVGPDGRNLLG